MISATRLRLVWATFALLLSAAGLAVAIDGVTAVERVQIGSDGPKPVLNGAGMALLGISPDSK